MHGNTKNEPLTRICFSDQHCYDLFMSRPLRIHFEGAWYHVMNRGACRLPIFKSDKHRQLFLELLEETVQVFKIEIHAYCLMDNHFHLLMRTPLPNLSKAMQYLSSVYTIRYNKLEKKDGPLFRGRFKSKLVEDEAYGLHVVRYIHLNQLIARITDNIENYKWSSYSAYLGLVERPTWLTISHTLEHFNKDNYFNEFRAFTHEGNPHAIDKYFSGKKEPPIIGSAEFVNQIKKQFAYLRDNDEISDRNILRPSLDEVVSEVAHVFKIDKSMVMKTSRSSTNYARTMAMLIAKRNCFYMLREIAEFFGVKRYQAISKMIITLSHKIATDKNLMTNLSMIVNKLK